MKIKSKKLDEVKPVDESVTAVKTNNDETQKPAEEKKPVVEDVVEKITKKPAESATNAAPAKPVEPLKSNAVQINITSAQDG